MQAVRLITLLLSFAWLLSGCGSHEADHHGREEEQEHHGPGDDAVSFSGATHKEGVGITLLPQTRKQLGVELADIEETLVPVEISYTAKVFTKGNGELYAAGILPDSQADQLKVGDTMRLKTLDGTSMQGEITQLARTATPKEKEVVVRLPKTDAVDLGTFVTASTSVRESEPVITVPDEALIRGVTESFVYVENGDAYLRTVVEPGRKAAGQIEIKDGLFEGDRVVAQGAMDLWLVELRAVKGGQGCCPAPPARGKKD